MALRGGTFYLSPSRKIADRLNDVVTEVSGASLGAIGGEDGPSCEGIAAKT